MSNNGDMRDESNRMISVVRLKPFLVRLVVMMKVKGMFGIPLVENLICLDDDHVSLMNKMNEKLNVNAIATGVALSVLVLVLVLALAASPMRATTKQTVKVANVDVSHMVSYGCNGSNIVNDLDNYMDGMLCL
jgi:hypothetical protein